MSKNEIKKIPLIGTSLADIKTETRKKEERPKGSELSLCIAQNALLLKEKKELLVVICANPADVIRLQEEIPFFDDSLKVLSFPDWETLPYDVLSPHADLVGERLETLYTLLNRNSKNRDLDILLVSATTATQRLAPKQFIGSNSLMLKKGENLDPQKLKSELVQAGYEHVTQVVAQGEFASRGSILDLYPMGSKLPFRLDFFDDELEQIRYFDPDSQRSLEEVQEIRLLPAHEFPMNDKTREFFLSNWRERFEGNPSKYTTYKDIENGIASPGIENYLPLFFDHTDTLFDFIGDSAKLMLIGGIEEAIVQFDRENEERAKFLKAENTHPILPLKELYMTSPEFFDCCKKFPRLSLFSSDDNAPIFETSIAIQRKNQDPLSGLKGFAKTIQEKNGKLLVLANSPGRLETIHQLFKEYQFKVEITKDFNTFIASKHQCCLAFGPLYSGLKLDNPVLAIVTEAELYAYSGKPIRRTRRKTETESNLDMMIRDLSELKVGDPIVHLEHGIGRYRGLTTIETPEGPAEFLQIEYAKEAKLYVPITHLHLISRYSGADPENAPLHALGKGDWEKAKKKAAKMVRDTAAELLNIYALRESRKGHAFEYSQQDYEAFCEDFPFEETEDQLSAIRAVKQDMESDKPMDRLVCGDVGFGKTEVALRAAFIAVMGHKQVAVLCPTTLLAEQHAETFRDRFSNWPVKVAELSRFRSSTEVKKVIEGLEAGTIDIVVGTHKLLSEQVKFKNLGLVIIDEEHRFGVRQKERLKAMRSEVDILTLTATPIPRTLSMSLEGIRDFSVIATAPQKRLAIKTFVQRETDSLVREASLRELKRGGQVYYLHNEVETIQNRLDQLQKLIPEARIGVAHGQMNERELEKVMRDFYAQRTNILLCTTIIETGIDVPNANTIIMHRADKFGLAQLHQLRGRVGRSHHQAYAYLLTPGEGAITKNAAKRLEAIQEMESLGSGFFLAMHDLEIRGAGEILGDNQSGLITGVGFEVYNQMVEKAVLSLKSGKEPDLEAPLAATTEINLHSPALLRSDYVHDVHQRLNFYKKLAAAKKREEIIAIQEEIADRFGPLTEESRTLIKTHLIRIEAKDLGIRKIDAGESEAIITFDSDAPVDPAKLFRLLQSSRFLKMAGPTKLKLTDKMDTVDKKTEKIIKILKELK